MNRFIKLYDPDSEFPDGYISSKDVYFFDICRCEPDYYGGSFYFLIKAFEKNENSENSTGWCVSHKIYDHDEAEKHLDYIVKELNR